MIWWEVKMGNIQETLIQLFNNIKWKKLKTPLEKITNFYGLEIQYEELEDEISGFLYLRSKKPIIFVNINHPPVRQNFTIAHEIGHYLLNHSGDLFLDHKYILFRDSKSSEGSWVAERQANKFAAELLMPESKLLSEIKDRNIDFEDDEDISNLAKDFGVSTQALLIRLSNLGLDFM